MKIRYVELDDICFNQVPYSDALYDSIKRIGLSFSIKTQYNDQMFQCIDGHKRLSVISKLKEEGIMIKISMIVSNNGDQRSNDCWRTKNTH